MDSEVKARDAGMRGMVFDVKKFSVHDGPGIRTTIFLKGCPLRCVWCHNPESIRLCPQLCYVEKKCSGCGACVRSCPHGAHVFEEGGHRFLEERCRADFSCVDACFWGALTRCGEEKTVAELMDSILEDLSFYEVSGGGVTLSGGEPLLQADFAAAILAACAERGIHTCVDTSGYVPWADFQAALPYTNMFLYDIKQMDEALHTRYTGAPNGLILENLEKLGECGVPIEIRLPVIPHLNDSEAYFTKVAAFLKGIGNITAVRLLPYNALAASKYKNFSIHNTMPPGSRQSHETMLRYGAVFERVGLPVVVGE